MNFPWQDFDDRAALPILLLALGALALVPELLLWRNGGTNWAIIAAGLLAWSVAVWLLVPKRRRR